MRLSTFFWIVALGIGGLTWGYNLIYIMYDYENYEINLPMAIGAAAGSGGLLFFATGLIAGTVYFFSKNRSVAMWTWTVLLLVVIIILTMGAFYGSMYTTR